MTRCATIFGVGGLAVLVGQASAACGPSSGPRPVTPLTPELRVPALEASRDGGAPRQVDEARFGHPMPVVADTWRISLRAVSRSTDPVTPGGAAATEQIATYESEVDAEVLAVDGPIPSRVRLRFLRNVQLYQARETPTNVHGKDYVVDVRAPHVRDASGAAAPEAEAQRVLDVFADLGTRARIDELLPDEPMHVGDRRDELAGAILRVIHPRAWTFRAGSARLARLEDDDAVFDVSLDAASEGGLHMALEGHARIRIRDARLSELALDGTYETSRDGGSDPPGTFSLRRRVTSRSSTTAARRTDRADP